MPNLDLLKPKVKQLVDELVARARAQNIDIIITQGYRTREEQDELYARGRTKPGSIVTNARGGYSFHNYGVAFDFAPRVAGAIVWNRLDLFQAVGAIGENLGLEWGGRWTSFKDYPHFQYTAGYTIENFLQGVVDWNKFAVHVNVTTMRLIKNTSSKKVYAIGTDNKKHWILNEETFTIGREMGLWGGFDTIENVNDDSFAEGHVFIFVKP